MAHPCDAMLCYHANGWGGVADHDVEREWRFFSQVRDQTDIRQTGRKQPICAGFRIRVCTLDRLNDHSIVILFGRSLEKDIGSSIDEEAAIGCIRGLPSAPDAINLIDYFAEFSVRRKAVLQVAAHGSRVDRQSDSLADHFRSVAIAAFKIDRDG